MSSRGANRPTLGACATAGLTMAAALAGASCWGSAEPIATQESPVALVAPARQPSKPEYAFALVSVSRIGAPVEALVGSPTVYMPQASLRQIVEMAYRVTRARTEGGPIWMDELSWRVSGRSSDPSLPYWTAREMLKSLLADRFQLEADVVPRHTSRVVLSIERTEDTPGIRSAAAKTDCRPFLDELSPPSSRPMSTEGWPMCGVGYLGSNPRRVHLRSAPLDSLALTLERVLNTVVVIEPAVSGLFDIDFVYPSGYEPGAGEPDIEAFAEALGVQLGIATRVSSAPVDILAITSAVQPERLTKAE